MKLSVRSTTEHCSRRRFGVASKLIDFHCDVALEVWVHLNRFDRVAAMQEYVVRGKASASSLGTRLDIICDAAFHLSCRG